MKTIFTLLIGTSIFLIGLSFIGKDLGDHNARCTGSANCNACSNCSRCGHCSAGGTCGVCRGSSSGRSFYSSKPKKTPAKKKNTSSSHNSSNNSGYGLYSGSSSKNQKKPIYYYDSNSNLIDDNFLYAKNKLVNIRKGPGKNYPIIETAKQNEKLIFISEEGNWLKIVIQATETEGYVLSNLVQ